MGCDTRGKNGGEQMNYEQMYEQMSDEGREEIKQYMFETYMRGRIDQMDNLIFIFKGILESLKNQAAGSYKNMETDHETH